MAITKELFIKVPYDRLESVVAEIQASDFETDGVNEVRERVLDLLGEELGVKRPTGILDEQGTRLIHIAQPMFEADVADIDVYLADTGSTDEIEKFFYMSDRNAIAVNTRALLDDEVEELNDDFDFTAIEGYHTSGEVLFANIDWLEAPPTEHDAFAALMSDIEEAYNKAINRT